MQVPSPPRRVLVRPACGHGGPVCATLYRQLLPPRLGLTGQSRLTLGEAGLLGGFFEAAEPLGPPLMASLWGTGLVSPIFQPL